MLSVFLIYRAGINQAYEARWESKTGHSVSRLNGLSKSEGFMSLKQIQFRLDPKDVRCVLQIALDDDARQTLAFVQTVLAKKVEKALQHH